MTTGWSEQEGWLQLQNTQERPSVLGMSQFSLPWITWYLLQPLYSFVLPCGLYYSII